MRRYTLTIETEEELRAEDIEVLRFRGGEVLSPLAQRIIGRWTWDEEKVTAITARPVAMMQTDADCPSRARIVETQP